ncbi:YtxH domain-containing protein [Hymenobacter tibetensis]|uniref:YtxH domain-containing protein n=1 Tax=Hymenobacter tibetensis TaxID=497967 RepID=A0ABY4D1B5_9BACT|nr:YtxH domain-containing protein [Hymenobacter tibetensis]UOG76096.1 YtxH domain-containing protein [Hymenobacter tibetensis]
MQDTKGKVIFSLLAAATAGIVTGLLLAPETGEETRAGLKKSAGKFSDDLNKLFKDGLSRLSSLKEQAPASAEQQSDRSAADSLLGSINTPGGFTEPALGSADDFDSDYDGSGGDARHSAGYGKGL